MAVGLIMGIENECSAEKKSHKFTALCVQGKFFYPDFFCRMGMRSPGGRGGAGGREAHLRFTLCLDLFQFIYHLMHVGRWVVLLFYSP